MTTSYNLTMNNWYKFNNPILDAIAPLKEMTKVLDDITRVPSALQEISNSHRKLIESVSAPLLQIQKLTVLNKDWLAVPNAISKLGEQLSSNFSAFQIAWKNYLKRLEEYYPYNAKALSKYGWFIELDAEQDMPIILENKLNEDSLRLVSIAIENYYREELDRIIEELYSRHSERHHILTEIYDAYKAGYFYTATMGLLSQIDGICYDRFDCLFFHKDKSNEYLPDITVKLQEKEDEFLHIVISPITEQCPIYAQEKDLREYPIQLNRHKILHGKDTQYGQDINFLKCLSLLKYMSDLLCLFNETELDESFSIS